MNISGWSRETCKSLCVYCQCRACRRSGLVAEQCVFAFHSVLESLQLDERIGHNRRIDMGPSQRSLMGVVLPGGVEPLVAFPLPAGLYDFAPPMDVCRKTVVTSAMSGSSRIASTRVAVVRSPGDVANAAFAIGRTVSATMTFFDRPSGEPREAGHFVSMDIGELGIYLVISDNRPSNQLREHRDVGHKLDWALLRRT
jgi:hypothetical protein